MLRGVSSGSSAWVYFEGAQALCTAVVVVLARAVVVVLARAADSQFTSVSLRAV